MSISFDNFLLDDTPVGHALCLYEQPAPAIVNALSLQVVAVRLYDRAPNFYGRDPRSAIVLHTHQEYATFAVSPFYLMSTGVHIFHRIDPHALTVVGRRGR